jgi:hypothetical protein
VSTSFLHALIHKRDVQKLFLLFDFLFFSSRCKYLCQLVAGLVSLEGGGVDGMEQKEE